MENVANFCLLENSICHPGLFQAPTTNSGTTMTAVTINTRPAVAMAVAVVVALALVVELAVAVAVAVAVTENARPSCPFRWRWRWCTKVNGEFPEFQPGGWYSNSKFSGGRNDRDFRLLLARVDNQTEGFTWKSWQQVDE